MNGLRHPSPEFRMNLALATLSRPLRCGPVAVLAAVLAQPLPAVAQASAPAAAPEASAPTASAQASAPAASARASAPATTAQASTPAAQASPHAAAMATGKAPPSAAASAAIPEPAFKSAPSAGVASEASGGVLNDAHANPAPNDPPGEWHSQARDYANTRYSPLDQINTGNVSQLRMAW